MKILDIKVLRGPNVWSNYRSKLIVLKLDLQEYESYPTNLLEGFTHNLIHLMPSLAFHHCSRNIEGGFIQRLQEGTWLGHVIEHVALELQYLAGMDCTFGRTRSSHQKSTYDVIFSYEFEAAGLFAANAAFNIVHSLAKNENYHNLKNDIEQLNKIRLSESLGPSTRSIVREAQRRNIPYEQLNSDSLIILGQGENQKKICAALTCQTSSISVDTVSNKALTKKILASFYVPVAKGSTIKRWSEFRSVIKKIGYPIVIKPVDGNHGKGVTTHIYDDHLAESAFHLAKKYSSKVMIEQFIQGSDFRFLVINHKVAAVAKRIPASVIGDGSSTIESLINLVNSDSKRGHYHDNLLTKISIDQALIQFLENQRLTLKSIPKLNEVIYLKGTANLSTGGTATDVTSEVHPYNNYLAERISRVLNLDICGIDIICKNIQTPIENHNGAVIEVNAVPGLRMHFGDDEENEKRIANQIVDLLYPAGQQSRIPIIAVTGTNGKTTTVRLLAHLAMQANHSVGYTTTDGIYLNHTLLYRGDCSGPISARSVLRDPMVNFAVLECARGGIANSGLGFDQCNISIVTNISGDHLGLDGIETLEELAKLKQVVPQSTFDDGYAILNADDDLVYGMKKDLYCNVALFSITPNNPRIVEHITEGGIVAYVENNYVIVQQGEAKTTITNLLDLPMTFHGKLEFMSNNILPSVLAGIICKFDVEKIDSWLKSFVLSIEYTPGRMNLFHYDGIKVLLDYGHNTGAFLELKKYIQNESNRNKIGIIASPGDRRDEDIENIGYISAQMFNDIIIRHDKDGRGRSNDEITSLLKSGILKYNPDHKYTIISDEKQALLHAMQNAGEDSFIVYFPEDIFGAIEHLSTVDLEKIRQRTMV